MGNLDLFINDFRKVKSLGFQESRRSNSTGIGKTFEDLLGIAENNAKDPDLHGFEIKSQRALSESYVTLFTKSPTMPKSANTMLRLNYGSHDVEYPDIKVLHTSIFHGRLNTHIAGYRWTIEVSDDEEKIYIVVCTTDGTIVNKETYFSYPAILKAMSKLTNLAYVSAEKRVNQSNGREEFHFQNAVVCFGFKGLEHFIELIKQGKIMFDIRIGAYKTGDKRGKTHDHGSGFRVKRENLPQLYSRYETIE